MWNLLHRLLSWQNSKQLLRTMSMQHWKVLSTKILLIVADVEWSRAAGGCNTQPALFRCSPVFQEKENPLIPLFLVPKAMVAFWERNEIKQCVGKYGKPNLQTVCSRFLFSYWCSQCVTPGKHMWTEHLRRSGVTLLSQRPELPHCLTGMSSIHHLGRWRGLLVFLFRVLVLLKELVCSGFESWGFPKFQKGCLKGLLVWADL